MLLRLWPILNSSGSRYWRPAKQLRTASQLATLSVNDAKTRPATFYKADILIIDSNNLAALGNFQRKEWGFKNYSYEAAFADHLKYIAALSESPDERYAVFDPHKGRLEFMVWRSLAHVQQRIKGEGPVLRMFLTLLERVLRGLQKAIRLLQGTSPKHVCWKTAADCNFTPMEPASGWAADDAIAALCKLFAGAEDRKSVLIVSNDRDLYQLLDDKISILHVPALRGTSSLDPYRVITLAGFKKQWQINPYMAPLFSALTGGRPFKGLKGLGMSSEDAAKRCAALYTTLQQDYPMGEHPSYRYFRKMCMDALSAENRRMGRGKKLSSRKMRLLIHELIANRETSSLPEQYSVVSSRRQLKRRSHLASTQKWLKSPLARIPNPLVTVVNQKGARKRTAKATGVQNLSEVASKRSWEFPTLIWMRPYNKGRANSVRQHVERLSRILHLLHIKHINWAVSAEWHAIDIAIVLDEHSAAFGLDGNTAFLVLGEGDLSAEVTKMVVSPRSLARIGTAQVLRTLLQHSDDLMCLSDIARIKVQSLEAEGWRVYKIQYDLLKYYYDLRFAER